MADAQFIVCGNIRLRASDGREWSASNIVTSGGLTMVRDYLAAVTSVLAPTPPQWIVYGSGTTPVSRFMTIVPAETFRTSIVSRDTVGAGISVNYNWFVTDVENTGQFVGYYGLVGGNDASLSPNTGTLVAIANEPAPFWKDSVQTYSGTWTLTISGVVN